MVATTEAVVGVVVAVLAVDVTMAAEVVVAVVAVVM